MEISNAYSQLSLSSGGASTGGASAGGAGAGVGFRVPEGMNTINNSIQQDMALQRMQQHQQQQNAATGMYTNNSNINNNHHHSMGFGVLSPRNGGSESSLNGMEVCSPHKKVRFFADPSGTASRTNMDEGLNNL